jgi:hypothetical protein
MRMQKFFVIAFILVTVFVIASIDSQAQCSICTRTAQQLGEKPARGLNAGIIYLAFTPLALIGFLAFKWWQKNRSEV